MSPPTSYVFPISNLNPRQDRSASKALIDWTTGSAIASGIGPASIAFAFAFFAMIASAKRHGRVRDGTQHNFGAVVNGATPVWWIFFGAAPSVIFAPSAKNRGSFSRAHMRSRGTTHARGIGYIYYPYRAVGADAALGARGARFPPSALASSKPRLLGVRGASGPPKLAQSVGARLKRATTRGLSDRVPVHHG